MPCLAMRSSRFRRPHSPSLFTALGRMSWLTLSIFPNSKAMRVEAILHVVADAEAGPGKADLANAPALEQWRALLGAGGMPVLWGVVTGHPQIGADFMTTSRLIAIDAAMGWARTVSRWYRLGPPFSKIETDIAAKFGLHPDSVRFTEFELPGFIPLDDPKLLDEALARYIRQVRAIDAPVSPPQSAARSGAP